MTVDALGTTTKATLFPFPRIVVRIGFLDRFVTDLSTILAHWKWSLVTANPQTGAMDIAPTKTRSDACLE